MWVSDDPEYPRIDVYGSLAELEADFGVPVTDLHRPQVDDLVRANPDDPTGRSMMRRVPEVLDCWFESGSMPFAQVHYPFENEDWFEHHHPGDFIVEYIGQTRGWFYTLHVLATALLDRPAFANCVSHGNVLGDALTADKRVRMVSFTGGLEAGEHIVVGVNAFEDDEVSRCAIQESHGMDIGGLVRIIGQAAVASQVGVAGVSDTEINFA